MSEKMLNFRWRQLGYKLGTLEKRHKLDFHLCDEILDYVERIQQEVIKTEKDKRFEGRKE